MDYNISFFKNNIKFNYRVAVVIRKDKKILVQEDKRVNYYAFLGGRCELGETSVEAAIREVYEETGYQTELVKELGIIENFFDNIIDGKKFHEILLVVELKFTDNSIYNKQIISNIESNKKDLLWYTWKSIDTLKKSDIRPVLIIDMLDKNEYSHYIYKQ